MGVSWLMKQTVKRLLRWEETISLPEPKRASRLRMCQYEEGQEKDVKLNTGELIKCLYRKLRQLAPLPHFCIPRLETSLISEERDWTIWDKVSIMYVGTPQISLHYSGFWGVGAWHLASSHLPTTAPAWFEACLCPSLSPCAQTPS